MAEPLTREEQHRLLRKAAVALIEAYDSYAISTSMIVLKRHVDILRRALDQPITKHRLWAIYDPTGVRCSGQYMRRIDALNSIIHWLSDYYPRGYRCRREEDSDG